ncbi:MAG TPA: sigma-70 family RNA polymerase sigma factor [Armatimonadota bacterium]
MTDGREVPSDEALVNRARHGESDALDTLVRRYQDQVYTIVLGMVHNAEDALDLTQDVFVRAFSGLERFAGRSGFYTWLYRIAVNRCIDHRRRKTPDTVSLDDEALRSVGYEPVSRSDYGDPVGSLQAKELEKEISRAVAALPDKLQTVVVLHDIEGLELAEIAQILGCRSGTAKSRLFRGRERIRQRISSVFLDNG